MQRRTLKLARALSLSALIVACLSVVASAQTGGQPKPVRFEKGRTTAVLKGTADNAHGSTYVLRAKAGQTMTVHLSTRAGSCIFSVTAPSGAIDSALEVSDWTGELPDSGEYLIAVWNKKKNGPAIPYTLEVIVR